MPTPATFYGGLRVRGSPLPRGPGTHPRPPDTPVPGSFFNSLEAGEACKNARPHRKPSQRHEPRCAPSFCPRVHGKAQTVRRVPALPALPHGTRTRSPRCPLPRTARARGWRFQDTELEKRQAAEAGTQLRSPHNANRAPGADADVRPPGARPRGPPSRGLCGRRGGAHEANLLPQPPRQHLVVNCPLNDSLESERQRLAPPARAGRLGARGDTRARTAGSRPEPREPLRTRRAHSRPALGRLRQRRGSARPAGWAPPASNANDGFTCNENSGSARLLRSRRLGENIPKSATVDTVCLSCGLAPAPWGRPPRQVRPASCGAEESRLGTGRLIPPRPRGPQQGTDVTLAPGTWGHTRVTPPPPPQAWSPSLGAPPPRGCSGSRGAGRSPPLPGRGRLPSGRGERQAWCRRSARRPPPLPAPRSRGCGRGPREPAPGSLGLSPVSPAPSQGRAGTASFPPRGRAPSSAADVSGGLCT